MEAPASVSTSDEPIGSHLSVIENIIKNKVRLLVW